LLAEHLAFSPSTKNVARVHFYGDYRRIFETPYGYLPDLSMKSAEKQTRIILSACSTVFFVDATATAGELVSSADWASADLSN
jgi:hypothetical protein